MAANTSKCALDINQSFGGIGEAEACLYFCLVCISSLSSANYLLYFAQDIPPTACAWGAADGAL